jgi:hypothetical protein
MLPSDKALPENTKENLDRKLDHAIEETFPTSDPVSVSVTKGGAIDYESQQQFASDERGRSGRSGQGTAESLAGQAKESFERVAGSASATAREAYEQGRRYVDAARDRYPQAERYVRESSQTVRQYAAENPLVTLLVGVGIGYAIAWMLHSSSERGERVPDYAKTRRGYSPHSTQPRA